MDPGYICVGCGEWVASAHPSACPCALPYPDPIQEEPPATPPVTVWQWVAEGIWGASPFRRVAKRHREENR